MKQRITIEQLKELTTEQVEHLQNLWDPCDGDWMAQLDHDYVLLIEQGSLEVSSYSAIKYNFCPLLTIGQMIEILQVSNLVDDADKEPTEYRITWRQGEELVDELWKSLKNRL